MCVCVCVCVCVHVHAREGQRERERENPKQAPHSVQSLIQGSISQCGDQDMSQNQELDTSPTKPPRDPKKAKFSINEDN